jgi:PAS domain S-box-containing protein
MSPENQPIRILFAEDLPADAEMARREIKKGGIEFIYKVVDTEPGFRKELKEFDPDIVVSDYSMPSFDGMTALKITRSVSNFIPFVVLTGSMNEETAVACMKAGANDYVIKEQIKRLPYAVMDAIEKSRDKLEKDRIEKQLHDSLAEFKDLINGMNETVWIIHPDGTLLDVNDRATKVMGYTREELLHQGIFGVDNNLGKEDIKKMAQNLQDDKTQFFHTVHTTKEGKDIPVEINSSLIKYRGNPAILSVARDISDRIRIEGELRLLSRSVEQSPVSIVITDVEGHIEYVNSTFTKITGYTFSEVKGSTPRVFKSGEQAKEFYEKLWNTLLSGSEWHGELINKKKSGENFWEDISISPIMNNKGKITHFVSVREDITEKKKMIEDLMVAKERAEESDRLKSAFLANMSHEIRTPMNGILGFADLLKEPKLSGAEKEQYVEIIQKSGKRMLDTINDLIDISKIESGTLEVNYSKVNVNEQLNYFYNFFKPEAESRGLQIICHSPLPDQETDIVTDGEKLNAALSNLIKNAIKYTNEGKIEFGYKRDFDHQIEFFVKDTGIGIEKERQMSVFKRFVQADTSLSKPYEGAGLGLSIAKGYIEKLGGKIWLDSDIGEGSNFYFTVPCLEKMNAKNSEKTTVKNLPIDTTLKELTILVAEDEEVARLYLTEILEKKCKKLLFAENGKQAVEVYKNHPGIDLVLMDIKMPVMDGYSATMKIKENDSNALVVAQTAYALAGDKEKALAAGCRDYLTKPLKKSHLEEVIQKYFG